MRRASTVKQPRPLLHRVHPAPEAPSWGQGRPKGWAAVRLRVLRRSGGLCECFWCKEAGRFEIAHEVDHIDNRRGAGYDDLDNLQAINRQCHERKTRLEAKIGRGLAPRPAWMDRWAGYGKT